MQGNDRSKILTNEDLQKKMISSNQIKNEKIKLRIIIEGHKSQV